MKGGLSALLITGENYMSAFQTIAACVTLLSVFVGLPALALIDAYVANKRA
jgi:hypothetical protein